MRALGPAELVDLWDRAAGLAPAERALALAAAAEPGGEPTSLAGERLGRCNALLLGLRAATFGPDLTATAACPACGETVELVADAAALAACDEDRRPEPVECDGVTVTWRSPTNADLAAAAAAAARGEDPEQAILERCVPAVSLPAGGVGALPPSARAAVSEAMAAADPLAEVLVDVTCPACGAAFGSEIDTPAFVWAEVEARARRLLLDVDVLARAYGWTEGEVLSLGEVRRAAYLRIVTEGTP